MPPRVQKGSPVAASLRQRLAAVVRENSERAVARECGCSRQSLARALAGLPVYPGTVALVEKYLETESPRRTAVRKAKKG